MSILHDYVIKKQYTDIEEYLDFYYHDTCKTKSYYKLDHLDIKKLLIMLTSSYLKFLYIDG